MLLVLLSLGMLVGILLCLLVLGLLALPGLVAVCIAIAAATFSTEAVLRH